MRHNKLELYLHLVWSTWDRVPLIEESIERRLYRAIEAQAQEMDCVVYALNGIADHVHILLEFAPTLALSALVKNLKGPSSLFANAELGFGGAFKWQGSYGAFTVSRWDVRRIWGYIENQKEHHASGTSKPALELDEMPQFEDEASE